MIKYDRRGNVETMSECSECTDATSVSGASAFGNRKELHELATSLGLASINELHQQRFRVDRRKLENMLMGKLSFAISN